MGSFLGIALPILAVGALCAFVLREYLLHRRAMKSGKGRSIPRAVLPREAGLGGEEPRPNVGGRYHWKN